MDWMFWIRLKQWEVRVARRRKRLSLRIVDSCKRQTPASQKIVKGWDEKTAFLDTQRRLNSLDNPSKGVGL